VKEFTAPHEYLGSLSTESAAKLILAASDIALIIGRDGLILDVGAHNEDLSVRLAGYDSWRGRRWIETVTEESRPKVEALLAGAVAEGDSAWRQLNHPSSGNGSIPILYIAVGLGDAGPVVALGRDLQAISVLQQRLVEAQQSMERDYQRLRRMETRYRLLFEISSGAVIILDGSNQKIVEANPAARELVGRAAKRTIGRAFPEIFGADSAPAVRDLLAGVRAAGRTDQMQARLAHSGQEIVVSASLFRQESSSLFLVQLAASEAHTSPVAVSGAKSNLLNVVENSPDGFVLTGPEGRIVTANAAFLDMAQLPTEAQAMGESLERWLGRPGADLDILIANLHQHGSVRLFSTALRGEYGATTEVEISAVSVPGAGQPSIGFAIRNIGRRLTASPRTNRELPRSMEQLTELIGRVSLKDLVRETTDVIERLCIETALEMTGDNRASAAEMLGVSRQSLYMKLRRYGLSESEVGSEEGEQSP
jgi:transcriptional regulator PpsR